MDDYKTKHMILIVQSVYCFTYTVLHMLMCALLLWFECT